jgi:sporulation protein YlmC with PRC-barrel domain
LRDVALLAEKIHVKDLIGLEVVGPHGWKIGTVENVPVDTSTWRVSEIEVKLEKEVAEKLNMKRLFRSTILPVGTERITGIGNVISINYTQEEMDNYVASQSASKKQ